MDLLYLGYIVSVRSYSEFYRNSLAINLFLLKEALKEKRELEEQIRTQKISEEKKMNDIQV